MTSCGIPGAHCMCVLSFVLLLASADGFSLTSSAVQPTRWLSTGARHLAFARPVPVVRVWRHGSGKCQMTGASTDRRLVVSKLLTWTVGVSVWGGAGGVAWAAAESTESAAERTAGATATLKKQQEAETENLKNSKLGQLLLKRTEQNKEKNAAGIRSRICSVQCPGKPLGREAVTELEAYCQDCRLEFGIIPGEEQYLKKR